MKRRNIVLIAFLFLGSIKIAYSQCANCDSEGMVLVRVEGSLYEYGDSEVTISLQDSQSNYSDTQAEADEVGDILAVIEERVDIGNEINLTYETYGDNIGFNGGLELIVPKVGNEMYVNGNYVNMTGSLYENGENFRVRDTGCHFKVTFSYEHTEGYNASSEGTFRMVLEGDESDSPGDSIKGGEGGASESRPTPSSGKFPVPQSSSAPTMLPLIGLSYNFEMGMADLTPIGTRRTAGSVQIFIPNLSPSSFTPAIISSRLYDGAMITQDANGLVNQIMTTEALLDVEIIDSGSFELKFTGLANDSLYSKWRFEEVTVDGDSQMRITKFDANGLEIDTALLEEINNGDGWQTTTLDGKRIERIWWEDLTTFQNGEAVVRKVRKISEVYNGKMTPPKLVARSEEDSQFFTEWNEWETVRSAEGIVGQMRETLWEFDTFDDSISGGGSVVPDYGYGKVKTIQYPDGGWVYYKARGGATTSAETLSPWKDSTLSEALVGDGIHRKTVYDPFTKSTVESIGEIEITSHSNYYSSTFAVPEIELGYWDPVAHEFVSPRSMSLLNGSIPTPVGMVLASQTTVENVTDDSPYGVPNKTTWSRTVSVGGDTVFSETSVYTGGTQQNPTKEVIGSTLYLEEKDAVTGWTTRKAVRNPTSGGEGFILSAHTYDERGRLRVLVGPDGVSTVRTYNELNQLHSERRSGLTTTYQYDVLGRVEETATRAASSNESLTTFTTYWPSGDIATYKDEDGLETSYFSQLTSGNRVETTERPDNKTEVKTYYRDGQLKSITGTGVVHRFYRYNLSDGASQIGSETIASGHITATEIIGVEPTGTNLASHRYSQTTVNGDGRAYLQSRPSFDGGVSIRKSFYNQNGALWKQTEPDLAPMLYVYNEFDQIERQGRDVNHDDFLSESTSASDKVPDDSISASSNDYYTDGANWFRRNTSRQWLEDGNANSTEVSVSLTQLTGLPANTVSRSVYTDIYGQDTVVTTTVSGTTVTTATDLPQSTMDKVTTTVNGRWASSTSATGSGITFFHYDAMGRLERVVGAMAGHLHLDREETCTM